MESPDLSKAVITAHNCPEHGSNIYSLEQGGLYCVNGHMLAPGYGKGQLFDAAAYYDTDDGAETLDHSELESALEYILDNAWEKDKSWDDILAELCPITVYAFQRKTVEDGFAAGVVDSWMDDFDEMHWCEEYGNFLDQSDPWSKEEEKKLREALSETLQKWIAKAHVWQCDQIAEAEFSEEEVRELMADYLREG